MSTMINYITNTALSIVNIPRPTSDNAWLINPFTGELVFGYHGLLYESSSQIRCRLSVPKSLHMSSSKSLVLHILGFDFGEEPSKLSVINKLGQTFPVLTVDKSHFDHKWPTPIQNVLDIYLSVVAEHKLADKLGFRPKRIILVGEKSGATIALNLVQILSDIRNSLETTPILMPTMVIAISPIVNLQPVLSPSRVLLTKNSKSLGSWLTSIESYLFNTERIIYRSPEIPYDDLKQIERYQSQNLLGYFITMVTQLIDFRRQRFLEPNDQRRDNDHFWLQRSSTDVKCRLKEMMTAASHPYVSPLMSTNFDHFPDMSLYVVVNEFDPFLDDAVSLCRRWSVKVRLISNDS